MHFFLLKYYLLSEKQALSLYSIPTWSTIIIYYFLSWYTPVNYYHNFYLKEKHIYNFGNLFYATRVQTAEKTLGTYRVIHIPVKTILSITLSLTSTLNNQTKLYGFLWM